MTNTLIAYYSHTGKTKQVAEMIASEMNAFVEPIEDSIKRRGFLGYMRSGWEGLTGKIATIKKPEKHPEQFDLLIVGTPVWSGRMSSPVRSYLENHHPADVEVAFFSTSGGPGNEKVIREMAALYGKQPIAQLRISDADFKSGKVKAKTVLFAQSLSEERLAA